MDTKTHSPLWFPLFFAAHAADFSRDSVVARFGLCSASFGLVCREPIDFLDHRTGLQFARRSQRASCGAISLAVLTNRGPKARRLLRKPTESRRQWVLPCLFRALSLRSVEKARVGSFPLHSSASPQN